MWIVEIATFGTTQEVGFATLREAVAYATNRQDVLAIRQA